MSKTVLVDGPVRVELDDGLEKLALSMLSAAEQETIAILRREAEEQASEARAAWYGPDGVTRKTGRSGDIVAVVTLDTGRAEIRASVGSTDTRSTGGKPVAALVHRPGPLSIVTRPAKAADFQTGKAKHSPPGKRIPGYGVVVEHNPKASDGKQLMTELVRKPYLRRIKLVSARLGDLIAKRVTSNG
jgi:hypothetical protein